jgi:hypothetical protein
VQTLLAVGERTYLTERTFACKIGGSRAHGHWAANWMQGVRERGV